MNEINDLSVEFDSEIDNIGTELNETAVETVAEPYAVDTVSDGMISEQYLAYFEGIVAKLDFNEHYVLLRSSDYEYILAVGENIAIDGFNIIGSDCYITKIYRDGSGYDYAWNTQFYYDDINIDCSSNFVYSDISEFLPTIERGFGIHEQAAVLFVLVTFFSYVIIRDLLKCVKR